MEKKQSRLKRSAKTRYVIRSVRAFRLTVHRTPMHIYAQVMNEDGSKVLVSVNTLQKNIKTTLVNTGNIEAAKIVGKAIAEKAIEVGITKVAFDRSGFKFHGRVKALAEAAREVGLKF
ncbi:MAG: 50S ribosomal protein L18 [Candidatus Methylumidiphilus sp.]